MPVERPTRGHDVVDVEEIAGRDANVLVLAHAHELCSAPRLVVVAAQSLAGLGHQGVTGGRGERLVVADGGDQLGIALDGLDQCPARSEQQAQAPGRLGRLPEGGDQQRALVGGAPPGCAGRGVRDRGRATATASRAASGSSWAMSRELRVRPPARSSTAARVRVASEKPKAARRRATASADITGPVAAAGAVAGSRPDAVVDGGERLEQRPEEEALVDGPHVALTAAQGVVEPGGGRVRWRRLGSRAPGRAGAGPAASVGNRVGLVLLDELQSVLDGAQEPVGVGQDGGVLGRRRTRPRRARPARRAWSGPGSPGRGGRGPAAAAARANSMSRIPPGRA